MFCLDAGTEQCADALKKEADGYGLRGCRCMLLEPGTLCNIAAAGPLVRLHACRR